MNIDVNQLDVPQISRPMVADLVGRIYAGQLKAQERMPPTRELALRYGISYVSAAKALEGIAREGLIRRLPGRGTFVGDVNQPPRLRTAHFLVFGGEQICTTTARIFQALVDQVRPAQVKVAYEPLPKGSDFHRTLEQLARQRPTAAVAIGCVGAEALEMLRDRGLVVVGIGHMRRPVRGVGLLDFDIEATFYRAIKDMQALGHRHIYLAEAWCLPAEAQAVRDVLHDATRGQCEFLPMPAEGLNDQTRRQHAAWIAQQLAKHGGGAVVACTQEVAEMVMHELEPLGLSVPEQVSIVTVGDNGPSGQQFSTWAPPAETCGREAGQMLLELAAGLPPRQVVLANQFRPGFSTAPARLSPPPQPARSGGKAPASRAVVSAALRVAGPAAAVRAAIASARVGQSAARRSPGSAARARRVSP